MLHAHLGTTSFHIHLFLLTFFFCFFVLFQFCCPMLKCFFGTALIHEFHISIAILYVTCSIHSAITAEKVISEVLLNYTTGELIKKRVFLMTSPRGNGTQNLSKCIDFVMRIELTRSILMSQFSDLLKNSTIHFPVCLYMITCFLLCQSQARTIWSPFTN